MSAEAKKKIEDILKSVDVTYSAIYQGQTKRDDWDCDAWLVAFTLRDGRASHEEFKFFTGLGLRADPTPEQKMQASHALPGLTQKDIECQTIYGRRYLDKVEKLRKPRAPHPADVLYSIVLDSAAVGQSFSSWCRDFGYDALSQKSWENYRACQENADKLARVFDHKTREAISDALQDY